MLFENKKYSQKQLMRKSLNKHLFYTQVTLCIFEKIVKMKKFTSIQILKYLYKIFFLT